MSNLPDPEQITKEEVPAEDILTLAPPIPSIPDLPDKEKVGPNEVLASAPPIPRDLAFGRLGATAGQYLEQLQGNIVQARNDSRQFFTVMLIFAGVGSSVVIVGVWLLYQGLLTQGAVAAAAGLIPQVAAAVFFAKDKELRKTIQDYHQNLITSQQVLTLIDVAETIEGINMRDITKQEIISTVLKVTRSYEPSTEQLETVSKTARKLPIKPLANKTNRSAKKGTKQQSHEVADGEEVGK
jgi:hypothetical protein